MHARTHAPDFLYPCPHRRPHGQYANTRARRRGQPYTGPRTCGIESSPPHRRRERGGGCRGGERAAVCERHSRPCTGRGPGDAGCTRSPSWQCCVVPESAGNTYGIPVAFARAPAEHFLSGPGALRGPAPGACFRRSASASCACPPPLPRRCLCVPCASGARGRFLCVGLSSPRFLRLCPQPCEVGGVGTLSAQGRRPGPGDRPGEARGGPSGAGRA